MEFRESGLLLFVNTFLHIFGWVIVIEMDDDGNECVSGPYILARLPRGLDDPRLPETYEGDAEGSPAAP